MPKVVSPKTAAKPRLSTRKAKAPSLSTQRGGACAKNGASAKNIVALPLETAPVRPVRWNRDQYARLAELGFFEDRRVELIEGEILEMAAMNSPHAASVSAANYALMAILTATHHVRVQCPLDLNDITQPEPDLAVVEGAPGDYRAAHRRPAARPEANFGHDYMERTFYRVGESVAPLCAPRQKVAITDLLP